MADEGSSKRRIHPEMLVGISAVIIGVCALGVSLYETSLMREEQRAAVVPLVELGRSYFADPEQLEREKWRLVLHAENVGIGPARVMDFQVIVDGIARPTWSAAMQALLSRDAPVRYGQSTINGRTIPPDRLVRMFDLTDVDLAPQIIAEFDRLDFEACFCSVFGDCWTTRYSTFGVSTPVGECSPSDDSFLE